MMAAEMKGGISLAPIKDFFVETLAARVAAKISGEFAAYLKNSRFDELFEDRTGETRESIGSYRYKSKAPAYTVRAGIGIPGNLNYLAGLYRGKAVSRGGKAFSYARKRGLVNDGWKAWGGAGKLSAAYEEILKGVIAEAEKKLEG
jgi:hypothetical protein